MDLETTTITGLARQYREEGYEVVVHPQGWDLPAFLARFAPDLIATRGREEVVVQALRDRGELARDPGVSRLAEALEARPGWRLDLILLGAGDDLDRAARGGGNARTGATRGHAGATRGQGGRGGGRGRRDRTRGHAGQDAGDRTRETGRGDMQRMMRPEFDGVGKSPQGSRMGGARW